MNIPPFPSQDLAKLVLGYLADEQLMTAYDEFLQASPYLDALKNEYDRLFMTSLKNILAEYRAMKIYVETCKPLCLRRKILQYNNLLEAVKFLVSSVDTQKLQDSIDKSSLSKSSAPKKNVCESCNNSMNCCTCVSRDTHTSTNQLTSQIEASTIENSVHTTLLSDLPGHITTRKINNDTQSITSGDQNENSQVINVDDNRNASAQISKDNLVSLKSVPNVNVDLSRSSAQSQFNSVLTTVTNKNISRSMHSNIFSNGKQDTFQEFASGITGTASCNSDIPDSSTSENVQLSSQKTYELNTHDERHQVKSQGQAALYSINSTQEMNSVNNKLRTDNQILETKQIPDEPKVKIISDVKVDKEKLSSNNLKMPAALKNATSTPLLHMQTILINGTSAYKQNYPNQFNYTKDEIMAMPTIILVPTTGASQSVTSKSVTSQPASTNTINLEKNSVTTSAQTLGPLILDVTSKNIVNSLVDKDKVNIESCNVLALKSENSVVKTGEFIKNASVPKDSVIACVNRPTTPHLLPPVRKSSSTPRRTSHIRVLDFTTPRRILHETLSENQKCSQPAEVVLSRSPNLLYTDASSTQSVVIVDDNLNDNKFDCPNSANGSSKENSSTKSNKHSWDSDLRALAVGNKRDISISQSKTKPRPKRTSKKKKPPDDATEEISNKKSTKPKYQSIKPTPTKSKQKNKSKSIEIIEDSECQNIVDIPVKPTINIISGTDWSANANYSSTKNSAKVNTEVETPEHERLCLQNEIGAKLNISDLLETPYKQALYDIQMDTPRFLGPDLPQDPMLSDIKITNIPTPRFLATPKPTPSSYSSRPTDYSSGGSYYKPDDIDYALTQEDLECSVPPSVVYAKPLTESSVSQSDKKDDKSSVKTRPVRKCTKNVSYVNSPYGNKSKIEKHEVGSSCSESISMDQSFETNNEKIISNVKTPKTKSIGFTNSTSKKKSSREKKVKSVTPVKTPKSFMKIKPRRPTPPRDPIKPKRKLNDSDKKTHHKKRTLSKDKQSNITPVIAAIPAKSRRKSSTPRKLNCTKSFHSESSGHESPETTCKDKESIEITLQEKNINCVSKLQGPLDSDTEQLALRWSDDGSRDAKLKEPANDTDIEDISKIQEYIESSGQNHAIVPESDRSLHIHLVQRGFDVETAKIIERDLLDTPTKTKDDSSQSIYIDTSQTKKDESGTDFEYNVSNSMVIVQEEEDEDSDEVELSIHECNEDTDNYVTFTHDESQQVTVKESITLKDKFCMEVCIDEMSIRLRASPFNILYELSSQDENRLDCSYRETELAVNSISDMSKLYTPMKEAIKAQCYEIFDSTLTSLDTPLKASPKKKDHGASVTEIVLEVEKVEVRQTISQVKDKTENRKRKRIQSGNTSDESLNENKKTRPETQYLLNSANIQNIDIESVLSKLHGP